MSKIPISGTILAYSENFDPVKNKGWLTSEKKTALKALTHLSTSFFDETIVVVTDKSALGPLNIEGVSIYENIFKNEGLLGALYTALSYSECQASCVLTCDMRFVDGLLIRRLADSLQEGYDAFCFQNANGNIEPFPGLYLRSSKWLVRLLLKRGEMSIRHLLGVAVVKTIPLSKREMKTLVSIGA